MDPAGSPLADVLGRDTLVPCADGSQRPYRDLDGAASTPAFAAVADRVTSALSTYASVHRGAGWKSRQTTADFEDARDAVLRFAGREGRGDTAIFVRNTTEAVNHLAFKYGTGDAPILTTVVEHHANLLPWRRIGPCRFIECTADGTFEVGAVIAALETTPRPRLLALTGASNVTGWVPPFDEIAAHAHDRGVPVFCDAAQLAPHRPVPTSADSLAFSGHKLHAPFGCGTLIGPTTLFADGDPFLAGGGAVDLVDLDEVIWTDPPDREEAGSPNVLGALALGTAVDHIRELGWDRIRAHDATLGRALRQGLAGVPGVHLLGPSLEVETLPLASFNVEGVHHALVAARLAEEWGIGVRHGCFCAHPLLLRLLRVSVDDAAQARARILRGDRRDIPGAVRASCSLGTSLDDVRALIDAVTAIAGGAPPPIPYSQDPRTGDYAPSERPGDATSRGAGCATT